jgi:hypothetical protein
MLLRVRLLPRSSRGGRLSGLGGGRGDSLFSGRMGIDTRRSCGSSDSSIAGGGASGLNSSMSSGGSTAAGVETAFADRVLDGAAGVGVILFADRVLEAATGVGVIRFLLPVDCRGAGVFCGDDAFRGCGVFRADVGGGGRAGAPPNEKLKAGAFLNSRGLSYTIVISSHGHNQTVAARTKLTRHPAVAQVGVPACLRSCQHPVTCHMNSKNRTDLVQPYLYPRWREVRRDCRVFTARRGVVFASGCLSSGRWKPQPITTRLARTLCHHLFLPKDGIPAGTSHQPFMMIN